MKLLKKAIVLVGLLVLCSFSAAAAPVPNNTLRVGLKYDSTAVSSFNMLTDYGYELGYYSSDNQFTVEARIPSRFVSVARDVSLKISGNSVSASPDNPNIKPYHLQLDQSFDSQDAAQECIQRIKDAGYTAGIFPSYINGVHLVRLDDFSSPENAQAQVGNYQAFTGGVALKVVGKEEKTFTFVDMNSKTIVFEFEPKNGYPSIRTISKSKALLLPSSKYLTDAPIPVEELPVVAQPENPEDDVVPPPTEEIVIPIATEEVSYIKNGSYYYSGGFEFRRNSADRMSVINFVNLEEYVKSVVPFEMSNSWPIEALKAQAVCARTYALTNISRHKSAGFNICSTTHCQAYHGNSRENETVRQAAYGTLGQVITYDGAMIATYYSSSSGGYTETNANAWGGTAKPYYAAVPDLYEPQDKITKFSNFYTLADLTKVANDLGANIGNVVDCYVSQYTEPAHNVYEVTFVGSSGQTFSISKTDNVRIKLSKLVKSPRFDIYVVPILLVNDQLTSLDLAVAEMFGITGTKEVAKLPSKTSDVRILTAGGSKTIDTNNLVYNFRGAGYGHNVGMSQYGAKGMAEAGFTYDQILKHYFTGVEITTLS